jgi:hypothetical protein
MKPLMVTKQSSQTYNILKACLFVYICVVVGGLIWLICAFTAKPKVTKGDVYRAISKDIRIGATKEEILQYVSSAKVNGIKANSRGYVKNGSYYTVTAPDNKEIGVEGTIFPSFPNEEMFFNFCPHVGIIFYFDKFDKLITYHIDCFG